MAKKPYQELIGPEKEAAAMRKIADILGGLTPAGACRVANWAQSVATEKMLTPPTVPPGNA